MRTDMAEGGAERPLLVDIPEACRLTSLSRSGLYKLMDCGQLRWVKIGRARRIPYAEIERLIAANTRGAGAN